MADALKEKEALKVNVLFRFSKKTGKIDTTITGLGTGLMEMWCLRNTTKSKACLIIERDTGKVLFRAEGTSDGFPKAEHRRNKDLGTCEDYGIPLSMLQAIKDERFDKEEV